jgi:hypothetical protein
MPKTVLLVLLSVLKTGIHYCNTLYFSLLSPIFYYLFHFTPVDSVQQTNGSLRQICNSERDRTCESVDKVYYATFGQAPFLVF